MHWFLTFLPLLTAAGLLYLAYRFATSRRGGTLVYNAGMAVAVVTMLLLFWINGAVGIIGDSSNDLNLLYALVVGGALLSKLRPRGMSVAMGAAAARPVMAGPSGG